MKPTFRVITPILNQYKEHVLVSDALLNCKYLSTSTGTNGVVCNYLRKTDIQVEN